MRRDAGSTDSIWPTTRNIETDGPLREDLRTDAVVVGAGVAGLLTAYHLMESGRKVVVLDDGPVSGGETARTTAHLVSAMDDRYFELERMHGEEGARLASESHRAAIDRLQEIAQGERISCDLRRIDGYLFAPPGDLAETLEKEYRAAKRAGQDVEWADRAPFRGVDTGRCLRFPRQGRLDPTRFMTGLAKTLRRGGVRIHNYTHASHLKRGAPLEVITGDERVVTADAVVEATNAPVFDHYALYLKQAPYRTYAIAAEARPRTVRDALYWDTQDPYHYARLAQVEDKLFLLVGGEDHHTGETVDVDERFQRLERWTRRRFAVGPVEKRWSGQVWEPVDSLGFIGRLGLEGNVYVATGDSGQGWTHGAIAGMLLSDLIGGHASRWESLYSPTRKTPTSPGAFVKENTRMVGKLLRLLKPGEVESVDDLPNGSAGIVRRGLKVIAAYRDESGVLHERNAVCRHMGCVVAWNGLEKSWDCPCHGSRFDRFGTVINGPANEDLKPVGESGSVQHTDGVRAEADAPTGKGRQR